MQTPPIDQELINLVKESGLRKGCIAQVCNIGPVYFSYILTGKRKAVKKRKEIKHSLKKYISFINKLKTAA